MASLIRLSSICSPPLLTSLSTLILSHVGHSSAACYTPEGLDRNAMFNESDGYLYAPCDNVVAVSMCCAIGPGRVAAGSADNCIPGGLCYNELANLYWRESCTDPTWEDPACIKLFVNGTGVTDVAITPCDDGSWCDGVGEGSVDCCKAGDGLFVVNGTETTQNPNSTTISSSSMLSTTTATPTTSSFSSPSASAISTTSGPGGLSSGTKIGLGVGIGVGVSAVLAIIGVCLLARHSRRTRDAHTDSRPDAAGPWAVQQPELKVARETDSHGMPPPLPELGGSIPKRKPVGAQGVTSAQSKNPVELDS
jgi:hypothetical protein